MKPLVYFVDKADDGKYCLDKEELKKILDEVYSSGYKDGYRDNSKQYPYVIPADPNFDTNQEWWKRVTCSGAEGFKAE